MGARKQTERTSRPTCKLALLMTVAAALKELDNTTDASALEVFSWAGETRFNHQVGHWFATGRLICAPYLLQASVCFVSLFTYRHGCPLSLTVSCEWYASGCNFHLSHGLSSSGLADSAVCTCAGPEVHHRTQPSKHAI